MLELKNISKKFDNRFVLQNISFQFPDKGLIGIQGKSGCGKSTLLYIIGLLDSHFEGEIVYNGQIQSCRKQFIRNHISFMMQNKDIISSMTIKENILLSAQVSHKNYCYSQLKKITTQLGIFDLLDRFPSQLSGGQLKRVSIAKALMKQSAIMLCDEPTGALHEMQANEVMKILKHVSKTRLVIVVSHHPKLLNMYCDSVLTLENGQLYGEVFKSDNQYINKEKKVYHSLLCYSLRQLFFQRRKLFFLFLFQWILILAFFLMTTTINGIKEAINKDEIHSVMSHVLIMENKDKKPFKKILQFKNTYAQYYYHLDQLHIYSHKQSINASLSFLPQETRHIRLQKGRFPFQDNEILVSQSLYSSLKTNDLKIIYDDLEIDLKIVGVLYPSLFEEKNIYCSSLLQEKIPFLKDDYSLVLESQDIKKLYQSLSKKFNVYSEVLERIENYQSILFLAQIVAYVFIGMSLLISLLLIGIVESILYYERKHDVAYLMSLGIESYRLIILSLLESIILGVIITVGGCIISTLVYYFFKYVYNLQSHFHFTLQLKKIWFHFYDIYFFIFIVYIMMIILGTIMPMKKMMKTDMITVLREE